MPRTATGILPDIKAACQAYSRVWASVIGWAYWLWDKPDGRRKRAMEYKRAIPTYPNFHKV